MEEKDEGELIELKLYGSFYSDLLQWVCQCLLAKIISVHITMQCNIVGNWGVVVCYDVGAIVAVNGPPQVHWTINWLQYIQ